MKGHAFFARGLGILAVLLAGTAMARAEDEHHTASPTSPRLCGDSTLAHEPGGAVPALLFAAGDYVAAGLMGTVTAAAVWVIVGTGFDLALAMVLGVGIGTLVHLAIGLLLSPVLGFFHVMVPGSLIGMYGGMLFAMRDAMQPVSLGQAVAVGAVFGAIVMVITQFYDHALAGRRAADAT